MGIDRNSRRTMSLVFLAAFFGAACTDDDPTKLVAGPSTTTTRTEIVLPGAASEYIQHSRDWVLPGRDYNNSRATFDSRVSSRNVSDLHVLWEAPVSGALSTAPIIIGETVHVQDGSGVIRAFDRMKGTPRWKTTPYGATAGRFGIAVADDRVFGILGSRGIVAVSATTGTEIWRKELAVNASTAIDIQPIFFSGKIFVSTAPVKIEGRSMAGARGVLHALSAETGETLWTFDTVKGDLWGHPEINSGGGARFPPAIDPRSNTLYWATASPAPSPGTKEFANGSSRPGANLYTNSALAIDIDSGQLRWHHQVHPHDLFDRDLLHTMISKVDQREVVVATGKGGVVVGLRPKDGSRIWSTKVGLHRNDDLQQLDSPTEVAPGTFGGVLAPPANADGIAYVAVVNAPTTLNRDVPNQKPSELGKNDGEIVAIDTADGAIKWSTKLFGDPFGGITIVNDLVLATLVDGTLVVINRNDGAQLLQIKLIGGANGHMSVAGNMFVVPVDALESPRLVAFGL